MAAKKVKERPGPAWIDDGKGNWVKPPQPAGDYSWDDTKGWVSAGEQASVWGLPLSIINSDPELQSLFDQAWAAQKAGMEWSQAEFTNRLRALNWYKTKSEAQRKYYLLANDPAQAAEFANQVNKSKASIQDVAGSMGSVLTDAQANELARASLQNGFNESELRNLISSYINYSGQSDLEIIGSLFGAAGDYEDQIRTWARKNGVTLSNDWILQQVRGVVAGDFTVDKSKDYINNIARQTFSAWADKIDNATSVLDLAAGYRQIVSDELDKPFDNVDLSNDYVKNAMLATGPDGKPITNDSLKTTLRKSDEWAGVTKNKEKVLNVANDLLSKFGMM